MKIKTLLLALISLCVSCKSEKNEKFISTTDIDNYWKAYDKITTTTDSVLQRKYLEEEFISKASLGQKTMFRVRNCTPEEYLENIKKYPKYWNSVRENTFKSKSLAPEINAGLEKLKLSYPDLKDAKVYFTIGAFKTGGTAVDSLVVFGTEKQLLDPTINTSEFINNAFGMTSFSKTDPIKNVGFTAVHEFVHTQQKSFMGGNLLSASMYEGVAEFVAEKSYGELSKEACMTYGKNNKDKILEVFKREMFNTSYSYWLWSSMPNQFNHRDLGYFVGHSIAEKFYSEFQGDKNLAIKKLIELDYSSDEAIMKFVDEVKFFEEPMHKLKQTYEESRPTIASIEPFKNLSKDADSGKQLVKIQFSEEMDVRFRGFEYGPLGADNVLFISKFIGFEEDKKTLSFEVELEPNKRFQVLLTKFRNKSGVEIAPYLIDITTK
ncbi:hypothetical protein [Tenacibaculum sp. 190524A05c]|uniref:DUF2268 domain-containing protein n=1 Tax=Tenacibaculum platacis TaxID=3137852 RepID=A0ABM9P3Y8_9FLAO